MIFPIQVSLSVYKWLITSYSLEFSEYFGRGLEKSSIIGKNKEYVRILEGWLKVAPHGDHTYWVRCYEAIHNGWSSQTFHHNCDNKGASVVIVKTQVGGHEYFFGGYNNIGWKGKDSDIAFTLRA